jgi:hypothetical protein
MNWVLMAVGDHRQLIPAKRETCRFPLSIHEGRQPLLTKSRGNDEKEWNRNPGVGFLEEISFPPPPSRDSCDWGDTGNVARLEDRPVLG